MENAILLLSSARGIYVPRDFAQDFNFAQDGWQGVSPEDLATLADPENDWYWETWEAVLNNAYHINKDTGRTYRLYQDGDLWAVCHDHMTAEEKLNFDME